MKNQLDVTNINKVIEQVKANPSQALNYVNKNDFCLAAHGAAEDVYKKLTEKLKGNKEALDLLFAYSHLSFCHYQGDDMLLSDIDDARKMICDLWQAPEKTPKKKAARASAK